MRIINEMDMVRFEECHLSKIAIVVSFPLTSSSVPRVRVFVCDFQSLICFLSVCLSQLIKQANYHQQQPKKKR